MEHNLTVREQAKLDLATWMKNKIDEQMMKAFGLDIWEATATPDEWDVRRKKRGNGMMSTVDYEIYAYTVSEDYGGRVFERVKLYKLDKRWNRTTINTFDSVKAAELAARLLGAQKIRVNDHVRFKGYLIKQ